MSRRPSHAKRKPIGKTIAIVAVCAAVVAAVACAALFYGDRIAQAAGNVANQARELVAPRQPAQDTADGGADQAVDDAMRGDGSDDDDAAAQTVQTQEVAQYDGVDVYSPVPAASVTGVLFHQASYDWALPMTTELPKADAAAALEAHAVRVNNAQTDGTWLDADALHVWRTTASTDMDTSIDIGAPAGTLEYAPVTGTVVLIAEYQLYNTCTDYEIHIQPDNRPDLDLVVIHDTDPQVAAGDHVTAGVTPIASVRDIASQITGIQLAEYTGTDGNHAHIQMNNADYPGYREKKLPGAVVPSAQ